MRLRSAELAKSTRPFLTRGYKIRRCEHCLIPAQRCICASKPIINTRSAFCFVMYSHEYFKPSNTGRIVADVVNNNHAFVWDRTVPDPALLSLLADTDYAPILVFPAQYAQAKRCIQTPQDLSSVKAGKIPLFVMLDGTWREAKKMFKSAHMQNLPILGIQPKTAANYLLREAAYKHQLCTAEVCIELLKLAQEDESAKALLDYFEVFRAAYMEGKAHR